MSVFPNPISDEIHLRFDANAFFITEIAIYDMMGRKVFAKSCELDNGANQIVLHPELTAGVYVLKVGSQALKIVMR